MKRLLLSVTAITLMAFQSCKKSDTPSALLKEQLDLKPNREMLGVLSTTTINVNPSTTLNAAFWTGVQTALASGPVDVIFDDGTYTVGTTIAINNIGHTTNLLTLKTAVTEGGAIFTGSIATYLFFTSCKNIKMERLKFTGASSGYAMRMSNCIDFSLEKCFFIDLPSVAYGALGIHYPSTNRVLVKNCTFENIGTTSSAHMIYCAYGVQRVSLIGNYFKNCAGSFVRFRGDLSDKGVVYDNDFISTGTYLSGFNPPFIEIPVFNDVNPGDEKMGTNFMITKNTFSYGTVGSQATRYNLVFHSSGYNPTGRTYLISTADAGLLSSGTILQKRSVMSGQLGLDGDAIRFGGNTNTNVQYNVIYRCWNAYGSTGPWTGLASIGTAVNSTGLATTESAAIGYYP